MVVIAVEDTSYMMGSLGLPEVQHFAVFLFVSSSIAFLAWVRTQENYM